MKTVLALLLLISLSHAWFQNPDDKDKPIYETQEHLNSFKGHEENYSPDTVEQKGDGPRPEKNIPTIQDSSIGVDTNSMVGLILKGIVADSGESTETDGIAETADSTSSK
jgi:hypothetical protein